MINDYRDKFEKLFADLGEFMNNDDRVQLEAFGDAIDDLVKGGSNESI